MRNVAMHMLTSGLTSGRGNAVAVHVQAMAMWLSMVMTRRRRRQVMIGANRTVQHESKRSDDRQSGRKTPNQRVDRTYHPSTSSRRMHKTVIVGR